MIFCIADVKEDGKVLKVKDECSVPTDAVVKPDEPATKSIDDDAKPSEQFVTTRLRSRAPSGGGGIKQKTLDESGQPEMVSAMFLKKITHSLIWRPFLVDDTPPLVPISLYSYCLSVVDVSLCSEVLQPGGSWSSSRSSPVYASNHQINICRKTVSEVLQIMLYMC